MSSVAMIESVATSLGEELRERFVFVGGAVLELLITDPTVIDFRPTTDVDLVVAAATYGTYASVEQTLADHGFTHVVGPRGSHLSMADRRDTCGCYADGRVDSWFREPVVSGSASDRSSIQFAVRGRDSPHSTAVLHRNQT